MNSRTTEREMGMGRIVKQRLQPAITLGTRRTASYVCLPDLTAATLESFRL